MPLRKISISGTEFVENNSSDATILHVSNSHALIQAAGYLKFTHASSDKSEAIYFRGERKIYSTLSPTLFRGMTRQQAKAEQINRLNTCISEFRGSCKIFEKFGEYAHEPLLQHYGIFTTWIDVVDNLWIALWFACHRAKSTGDGGRYLHFEKRTINDKEKYAYIVLVAADIKRRNSSKPGFFSGDNTELVDLRMAAPSIFLRPHAQHGLLIRCKGDQIQRPSDYSKQIRGIIRVNLFDALAWLGSGHIVGSHALFPPAFYDSGYRFLIESPVAVNKYIGGISIVGA